MGGEGEHERGKETFGRVEGRGTCEGEGTCVRGRGNVGGERHV